MFGIFNKLNNYQLLRFSNAEQGSRIYTVSNYPETGETEIEEVCIPVEYNFSNIGKFYNPDTGEFYV
jgi:hypothetical protein